jgi:RHS repeat-associated protein
MQLGSSTSQIPDGLLAAITLLREKPHQGVPSRNLAPHQGIDERNSTAALGLRASEHLNRVWPRYTGKERDTESGNDYFLARYYSSSTGRFLSPDWSAKEEPVPYAKLDNPQTLNLYSYVQNNPLSRVDADGHVAGVDDAAIILTGAAIGGAAVIAYYEHTPAGQRSIQGAGEAVSHAVSSGFATVKSWFSSSSASHVQAGQKDADFVVTPGGTVVATDPGRVRDSLSNAPGVKTTPVTGPKGETGTIQTPVQTPNGPVDVRTMDGSTSHGPRTVITHPGTNSPKTPDGKATGNKNDNHIPNDHDRPGAP